MVQQTITKTTSHKKIDNYSLKMYKTFLFERNHQENEMVNH